MHVPPPADRPRRDPLPALAAEPWNYTFYQAMRLLENRHRDKPRFGTARRPADEAIRLGEAPELTFAPAPLAAVHPDDRAGRPRVEVRFFGLFGPNGPLPMHLTGYARDRRLHRGDETFNRFADLFHHRLLLLFYRAWAQAQPTVSLDRPEEDRFADFVGSLIGIGGAPWHDRGAAPHHAKLAFAGVLSRQARNADGLAQLLAGWLRTPVRVEPFAGRWMALPPAERSRIGRPGARRRQSSAQLGASAVLGGTVFDRQHHFRVHVGPVGLAAFVSLLPSGSALPAVEALVAAYVGDEFGWDLELKLHAAEVPPLELGRGARLGWTSWAGRWRRGEPAVLTLQPGRRVRPAPAAAPADASTSPQT